MAPPAKPLEPHSLPQGPCGDRTHLRRPVPTSPCRPAGAFARTGDGEAQGTWYPKEDALGAQDLSVGTGGPCRPPGSPSHLGEGAQGHARLILVNSVRQRKSSKTKGGSRQSLTNPGVSVRVWISGPTFACITKTNSKPEISFLHG